MARELSIAALEATIARQRSRLEKLRKQRGKLAVRIQKIDRQIEALQGDERGAPRRRVKRARSAATVSQLVTQVLQEAEGPLRVKEIAGKVLESGYKTTSKNFKNVVAQFLYKSPLVRRAGRGKYTVKKAVAAKQTKPTARKKKATKKRK